jgi:NADH:ubiquinone oxidoreductase subunit 5 (subunit L)/multisubunit Na+/H+ antiporter MnhA subunit
MFLAVGSIYAALGHDRITGLSGVVRALPLSVLAFAIGGLALMGFQPSGAALAKELWLQAAARTGQWWWSVVLQAGAIFTTAYVVLVLAHALAPSDRRVLLVQHVSPAQGLAALALSICSLLLGLLPWELCLPIPPGMTPKSFSIETLAELFLSVLAGAALAILFGSWAHPPASAMIWKRLANLLRPLLRACAGLGSLVESGDRVLRQWSTAGICMLLLALTLAALTYATN